MLTQNRIRDEKHRRFIASLPCCITGNNEVQAAHIRHGCYSMGMKPCDSLVVPLYWLEHQRQHSMSESEFWEPYGGIENAKKLALLLYENTGNRDKCIDIINKFKLNIF